MRGVMHFFDNESPFGRICTLLGTIIIANLMFVITIIPVITIGAGVCGLYYTMLKLVRYKEVNPFEEFFKGFRENFKRATITQIVIMLLGAFIIADIYFCRTLGGMMQHFETALYAVIIAFAIIIMYLFPVIVTFNGGIKEHIKFSIYFAFSNPLGTIAILVMNIVPIMLTYMNMAMLPLSAFIWCICGFAVVTFCNSMIMMRRFRRHLEPLEQDKQALEQKRILEEMKMLEG